jgi:hypothetical protein
MMLVPASFIIVVREKGTRPRRKGRELERVGSELW